MQQRTLEFGIRLAVGADGPQLRNLILRQAMTLAVAGVAAGPSISNPSQRFGTSSVHPGP
jgi:hypothetical protein